LNLRFSKGSETLDEIIKFQHSPLIKTSVGFHETIIGESASQIEVRNSTAKSEMLNKEIRGQPHQQTRKESHQRK